MATFCAYDTHGMHSIPLIVENSTGLSIYFSDALAPKIVLAGDRNIHMFV